MTVPASSNHIAESNSIFELSPSFLFQSAFLFMSASQGQGGSLLSGAVLVGTATLATVAHQAGHSLAIRKITGKVVPIKIAFLEDTPLPKDHFFSSKERLMVHTAGPVANLFLVVLGKIGEKYLQTHPVFGLASQWTTKINTLFLAINLLPSAFSDGGEITEDIAEFIPSKHGKKLAFTAQLLGSAYGFSYINSGYVKAIFALEFVAALVFLGAEFGEANDLDRAKQAFDQGSYEVAEEIYQEFASQDRYSQRGLEANFMLAQIYQKQGKKQLALDVLDFYKEHLSKEQKDFYFKLLGSL